VPLTSGEVGVSVLANLAAWFLTVRVTPWLQAKSWRFHLLLLGAMLGATAAIMAAAKRTAPSAQVVPVIAPSNTPGEQVPVPQSESIPAPHRVESKTRQPLSPEDTFTEEYVGSRAGGPGTARQWAVVLRKGEAPASSELIGAIAKALSKKGYNVAPVFRPDIFHEQGYRQLFGADSSLLGKLEGTCSGVIAGEVKETSSTDENIAGLVTARLTLDAHVFLTKPPILKMAFQISEKGAGFSEEAAEAQANERLARALQERLQQGFE
jgi:hypothetical protein